MSAFSFRSSRPHAWIAPRPYTDAHSRYLAYGPIQPMDTKRPGLLHRLLGFR